MGSRRILQLAACGAVLAAAAAAETPEARYQAMLTAAQAGDRPVDWQALRFAFADRPGAKALDDRLEPLRAKMIEARQAEHFPEALADAKRIIERDYVDAEAHLTASIAYGVQRQRDDASRERAIALALYRSMETGDGLSIAGAFTAISPREEAELMAARQCRVTGRTRRQAGGHTYDVVAAVDKNGDSATFYFLVDRIVAEEKDALRPRSGLELR
jgi:hypothetical protein